MYWEVFQAPLSFPLSLLKVKPWGWSLSIPSSVEKIIPVVSYYLTMMLKLKIRRINQRESITKTKAHFILVLFPAGDWEEAQKTGSHTYIDNEVHWFVNIELSWIPLLPQPVPLGLLRQSLEVAKNLCLKVARGSTELGVEVCWEHSMHQGQSEQMETQEVFWAPMKAKVKKFP